jgi:DNA integrity scanning protein DisA with diadenylate cyclase activity
MDENNTIKYFIWGYQRFAQIGLQVSAETLFDKIDKRLRPNVFFIGVLTQERNDRHKICIEPDDTRYKVSSFTGLKSLAEELRKVDKESKILHSHPIAQQAQDNRTDANSFRTAILEILNREDYDNTTTKFVSYPTFIEGFLVFIVLELQTEAIDRYYSLNKTKVHHRYDIRKSLIDSAATVFLSDSTNTLFDYNKAKYSNRESNELLREAAKDFMYTISYVGQNFHGLHGLYEACNAISALKYEGEEGLGKLLIAKKDHPNIKMSLTLTEPIDLHNFRKVRKFLELTTEDSIIICDSALIYGLGQMQGKYNPKEESLFEISFLSHYKWQLSHDRNPMLVVIYEQPTLPKENIDREKFYSTIKRVFKGIGRTQIDDLWLLILKATEQAHGTMIVISDKAESEAKRLGKQSFQLHPLKLTTDKVNQLTTIDGSVLIDRNSTCFAIGVILDGLATNKGDSSRGARYNSAIRYYEYYGKDESTLILIVSEDGMINIIPDLRPQIKHSDITRKIDKLEALSSQDKITLKEFNKLMLFFKEVNFYLTKKECDKINLLRQFIESKFQNKISFLIKFENLNPDVEMNASYYLVD